MVACVQLPWAKPLAFNLRRTLQHIEGAAQEGARVVLFPEAALSGYFLEGGVAEALTNPSALDALSVPADHPAAAPPTSRPSVRPRWLGWVVPVCLVALAGLAAWGWLRPMELPEETPVRFEVTFPLAELG